MSDYLQPPEPRNRIIIYDEFDTDIIDENGDSVIESIDEKTENQ